MIHDDTACKLGEGPLWHPQRKELFWFDILGKTLHSDTGSWAFDEYVSAAGWVDRDTLIVASQTCLSVFDIATGASEYLTGLEADNPITRSNDGRADPYGGFWIGTMGIDAQKKAGGIYRYYRGEVRQLFPKITISNAICFAPDASYALFTDTPSRRIMKVMLGSDGWPDGAPQVWLDLYAEGLNPDGAVIDAAGNAWNAQWGAGRVACYAPDATFLHAVDLPASQTTCPAFGGDDLRTLFCTSAADGLAPAVAHDGKTFSVQVDFTGQAEHQVIL